MPQTIAKTLVFVALIATVAAPRVMACHGGTEFSTCCDSVAASAHHSCCQKTAASFTCGMDHNYVCCRPADPRDSSTNRPADLVTSSTALAILNSAPVTLDATFAIAEQSLPPGGGQIAIPHRILHCSWLI